MRNLLLKTGLQVPAPLHGGRKQMRSLVLARTGATILSLWLAADLVVTGQCVPAPANLAAWWPFDETTGTTAAELVYNNNGIHQNGPISSSGVVGSALRFDGMDDYVQVAEQPAINFPGGRFTVDFWIFPNPGEGSGTIVRKGSPSGDPLGLSSPGYHLLYDNGHFLAFFGGAAGAFQADLSPPPAYVLPGQWTFVTITVDLPAKKAGLYLDGVLVQITPLGVNFSDTSNQEPLIIGGYELAADPTRSFDGRLDELELFNRVLNPSEITVIFLAADRGKCKADFLHPCLLGIEFTPSALLHDIDPLTGLASNPRNTGLAYPIGLEVTDNGEVYAITQAPDNGYYKISRTTGVATPITTMLNYLPMQEGDMALNPAGGPHPMYFTSQNNLAAMEVNGSGQTIIGIVPGTPTPQLSGIAFNSAGQLFAIDTAGSSDFVLELLFSHLDSLHWHGYCYGLGP